MANEVEIRITATDLTGPAFAGVLGRLAALKKAADAAAADRQMQFSIGDALAKVEALKTAMKDLKFGGIDMSALNASLISLRSKLQSLGIADLADINVQPGRLMSQMQLIKRLTQQAGIHDILDFNLTPSDLTAQLNKLGHVVYDVPIKFDMSRMPSLGKIGTERIPLVFDIANMPVSGPTSKVMHIPADIDVKNFMVAGETMPVLKIPAKIDLEHIPITGDVAALGEVETKEAALVTTTRELGSALRETDTALSPFMQRMLRMGEEVDTGSKFMAGFDLSMIHAVPHVMTLAQMIGDHLAPRLDSLGLTGHQLIEVIGSGLVTAFTAGGLALGKLTDNISMGIPVWKTGGGWLGGLTGHLQTWGGAITSILPKNALLLDLVGANVSGWHLLADAIIETSATLIPAIVGMAVFGAAASQSVQVITNHLQNMDKAIDLTGKNVYPLTGGFSRMADAVKPEVYVLFGEGLAIANKNAGAFQGIAVAAGKALDDLGARTTYAINHGEAFQTFLHNSAADLSGWGNLVGNIGGIIGNVLKAMPGYAEILLNVANGVTHVVEAFTGSGLGQAIIGFGLSMHGAIVYIGILGTAAAVLASRTMPLLAGAAMKTGIAFEGMGLKAASAALGDFAATAEGMAALPWGWIMLAAAGIGVLVYNLINAKSAAQQFADGIQKMITETKLADLGSTISNNVLVYASALKEATVQTAALQKQTGSTHMEMVGHDQVQQVTTYSQATYDAMNKVQNYGAALAVLKGDQKTYNDNLAEAAKALGGTKQALDLLSNAGITSAQMLTTNKQQMAENIIEAQAYGASVRALTNGTGQFAAAMNALSGPQQYLGDFLKNIQSITQQMDNVMQVVTQSSTSFDTFALGQLTLAGNFGLTAKQAQGLTHHLGDLSLKTTTAGATMGGLNQASLTLSQTFYQQVGNAQKVIDSLMQAEMPINKMTAAVGTLAGQMLPFAQNDEAARATIVALINNALGPGTVSLQNLNTWVKQNSSSMQGLNSIIEQATVKTGTLANVLETQLNNQFDAALLKSSGATKAVQTLADAITNTGNSSTATANARKALIDDLINTGMTSQDATTYVDGLQKKIDAMHGSKVSVDVTTNGYTVTQTLQQMINSLHGTTINIGVTASGAIGTSQLATGILNGMFATGGVVGGIPGAASGGHRSGLTLVGELGPELVRLPHGSQVYPTGVTPGYGSQGGGWDGSAMNISLMFSSSGGQSAFDRFMAEWIRNFVRVKGAGNVQKAFGHN